MPDKKPDNQNTGVEQLELSSQAESKNYAEEQAEGVKFLRGKFKDFHSTTDAVSAAKRKEARANEKVSQKPEARIANYLHRFREILDRKDEWRRERGIEALKKLMHRQHVIKPADIPESYFEKQKELVRQRGHGDIEMSDEMRRQLIETIIADQNSTLDTWLNYLTSHDAEAYPDWSKYWSFRSMLGLSTYDKEKKRFGKRRKDTVAPFPDLNREALAYVVDIITKKAKGQHIEVAEDNPELQKLIKSENFAKLYAYAIEKVTPAEAAELEKAAGEWVVYRQGSDHMPLVKSLQGHGTGWCTAGESTAEAQLKTGDFHVYYSYDKDGKPTIPRIAIRMEHDQIAEVRGVAAEQNLDPYVAGIAEKKLSEFPDGAAYQKKADDMKRLTEIEKKNRRNEELTTEDIRFLYELDSTIQSFGYSRDPRIDEIKKGRNIEHDTKIIDIITTLAERFTNSPKHYKRPKGVNIAKVIAALEANPEAMNSLRLMEFTGGAPDIIAETDDEYIFADCSAESPLGRRSLNLDESLEMMKHFGSKIMDNETYKEVFQKIGQFDLDSWSWLVAKDPEKQAEIREAGDALDGGRRGGVVGVGQFFADRRTPDRGVRGLLRVQKA